MPDEAAQAIQDIGDAIVDWPTTLFTHGVWYTLIMGLVVGLVSYALIKLLDRISAKRRQGNLHFFFRLINVVIITVATLIVMMTIKPLATFARTLLAGSGLLAVVIGIAAQAALGNVFSGISIGLSRPFVIGETIEIIGQDITGIVTEISLRQTVIRDLSNKYIVVPNSVIDKEIIRTVSADNRAVINYLYVIVGYGSDIAQAIDVIRKAVLAHKDFHDTRTRKDKSDGVKKDVSVAVIDLGESAVSLRASVWSKDAGTGFMMLSDLRQTILSEFARQGIEIPYAYRNVILHEEKGQQPSA